MTASEEGAVEGQLPRGESTTTVGSLSSQSIHGSRSQEPLVACNGNGWNLGGKNKGQKVKPDIPGTDANSGRVNGPIAEEPDDNGGKCGWWCFKPDILQRFRSPQWVLFFLCWAGALQGLIVNGFVNVVITTIEKRYHFRSTESGLIAGGYDIASFLCLIPVSYFGASRRKPLFIGCGVLILALGSFVFSLPHFLTGPNQYSKEEEITCNKLDLSEECSFGKPSTSLNNYKYVFLLGQLLHGVGASPFYTLGCTYLDENVSTKMSSVYIGIYYTMAVFGPAVGYILGGQFLKIYTDIGVDTDSLGLTSASSVWVGAWWIGFVLAAGIGVLVAIPLTGFPKILPGALKIQAEKVSEMHQKLKDSEAAQSGFGTKLADLPASFKYLMCNPTFLFLSFAGASEGMLVSGLATFMPKIIESQFSIAASSAALLVGLVTVPGAGGGTFLGGYLVKRLQLRCSGIIKMCIVYSSICLCFGLVFIIYCPNTKFFGLNYKPDNRSFSNKTDFISECNAGCNCSRKHYDPICGTDNVLYYSPCFAGCKNMYSTEDSKVYQNCDCISAPGENVTLPESNETVIIHAKRSKCVNDCAYLPAFLILLFLCMLFTFLVSMPSLSATLRCVADSQKSFALGIQWIAVRLLGTIPAPIIFGSLIDMSCMKWQESCDGSGACIFYDNLQMNRNTLIIACILKSLSTIFFFSAWFLYKPPECDDAQDNDSTVQDTIKSSNKIDDEITDTNVDEPHRFRVQTANGVPNGAV